MDFKNELLAKFFKTFDLDKEGLNLYCIENNIQNSSTLIEEFEDIRTKIYDHLWEITKPDIQLSPEDIVLNSAKYLKTNYDWIDAKGMKPVNNFLLWMCWHEGIMDK